MELSELVTTVCARPSYCQACLRHCLFVGYMDMYGFFARRLSLPSIKTPTSFFSIVTTGRFSCCVQECIMTWQHLVFSFFEAVPLPG